MPKREYKDELLAEWARLRAEDQVTWDDWGGFIGAWKEFNGSPYKRDQEHWVRNHMRVEDVHGLFPVEIDDALACWLADEYNEHIDHIREDSETEDHYIEACQRFAELWVVNRVGTHYNVGDDE